MIDSRPDRQGQRAATAFMLTIALGLGLLLPAASYSQGRPSSGTDSGRSATPTQAASRLGIVRPFPIPYPEIFGACGCNPLAEIPTPTPTPLLDPPSDGIARRLSVPILMYHYISTPPDPDDPLREDLSVSPQRFADQLSYLQRQGYTAIPLDDLVLALTDGSSLPPKPIVLTFDDGYRDHYENAFPLLEAVGYTGTFFVVTSFLDQNRPEYLSWENVIEMNAAGMRIESHAYSHVDLRDRDADYLVWQMLGSKQAIEKRTGRPVRFFCYPAGHYDALAIQVLRSAHYWGATTILPGEMHASDDLFELKRIRVRGSYSLPQFAALLRGASGPTAQRTASAGLYAASAAPTRKPSVDATPSDAGKS